MPAEVPEAKALARIRLDDMKRWTLKTRCVKEEVFLRERAGTRFRRPFMNGAKRHTDMDLKEIGALFGTDYTAVSRACAHFERRIRKDAQAWTMAEKMEHWIERR